MVHFSISHEHVICYENKRIPGSPGQVDTGRDKPISRFPSLA